jgi:hypothetical protein
MAGAMSIPRMRLSRGREREFKAAGTTANIEADGFGGKEAPFAKLERDILGGGPQQVRTAESIERDAGIGIGSRGAVERLGPIGQLGGAGALIVVQAVDDRADNLESVGLRAGQRQHGFEAPGARQVAAIPQVRNSETEGFFGLGGRASFHQKLHQGDIRSQAAGGAHEREPKLGGNPGEPTGHRFSHGRPT